MFSRTFRLVKRLPRDFKNLFIDLTWYEKPALLVVYPMGVVVWSVFLFFFLLFNVVDAMGGSS